MLVALSNQFVRSGCNRGEKYCPLFDLLTFDMDIRYCYRINHSHQILGILSPFLIGYDGLESLVHLRDGGSEIRLYIWNLRSV